MKKIIFPFIILFVLVSCNSSNQSGSIRITQATTPSTISALSTPVSISTTLILETNNKTKTPNAELKTYPREVLFIRGENTMGYLDGSEIIQLSMEISPTGVVATTDGTEIVLMEDQQLYVINLKTGIKTHLPQPDTYIDSWSWGEWNPTGRYFAYSLSGVQFGDPVKGVYEFPAIYISDTETDSFIRITSGDDFESYPRWSSDGRYLAYLSDKSKYNDGYAGNYRGCEDIFLLSTKCMTDLSSCQNASSINMTNTGADSCLSKIEWNPSSTALGYVLYNNITSFQDIYSIGLDKNARNLSNTPEINELAFDWSPDGDKIALIRSSTDLMDEVCIQSIKENTIECLGKVETSGFPQIYWSPSGKYIAVIDNPDDKKVRLVIYDLEDNTTSTFENPLTKYIMSWATISEAIK
jgi:Tol biopolymer transport system component